MQKTMEMKNLSSIDEYINEFPTDMQKTLQGIRNTIHSEAPHAEEAISYGMPTFKLNGINMIHFAAFKNHIGIYPTSSNLEAHIPEVAKYRTGKGTLQFPLGTKIPMDMIRKITQIRVKEIHSGTKTY